VLRPHDTMVHMGRPRDPEEMVPRGISTAPHAIPRTEVHHLRATGIDQEYPIPAARPRGHPPTP
jgi:hypothetical protein